MDFLLVFHSLFRWVVLVVLLGAAAVGILQAVRRAPWRPGSDRPFLVATIVLDLQVGAGVVLWLFDQAWARGFFFAVLHPGAMLLATALAHLSLTRARGVDTGRSYPLAGGGLLLALVIVVLAIPRGAW